jgi:DNA-binding response OmpR family regulator
MTNAVPGLNKRVLVVEDDGLLALDIAQQLTNVGFLVVGPATTADRAIRLIEDRGCDAALLDVNLGKNQTSAPVARKLRALGIPFVVLSGYLSDQHPLELRGAPALSKPASERELLEMLLRCMQSSIST